MNVKRLMTLVTSVLGASVLFGAELAHAQTKLPLVEFFSVRRGDHYTTSDPNWTCHYFNTCTGPLPETSYVPVAMQGHVYNPARPAPAGTVPLYQWFSAARGDNFVTTNPVWAGTVGEVRYGYTLIRIEGFIPESGLMPLKLFWNSGQEDNSTVATWRFSTPSGYAFVRTEGSLLPPDGVTCTGTPPVADPMFARANFLETWRAPADLLHNDRFKFTGPADWYRYDWWDHHYPVRGYSWSKAGNGAPAPGQTALALMARVTTGRVFTAGGWFEANQWFRALGEQEDFDGPCNLYDATGVTPGNIETVFNDDNISDNGGGANLVIKQWF